MITNLQMVSCRYHFRNERVTRLVLFNFVIRKKHLGTQEVRTLSGEGHSNHRCALLSLPDSCCLHSLVIPDPKDSSGLGLPLHILSLTAISWLEAEWTMLRECLMQPSHSINLFLFFLQKNVFEM